MSTTENDNHGACMDQLGRTVRVGTPRTSIPRQTCRWCARSGEMSTDAFIVLVSDSSPVGCQVERGANITFQYNCTFYMYIPRYAGAACVGPLGWPWRVAPYLSGRM